MHPPLERTATLLTVDVLLEGLLGRPVHESERVISGAAVDSRQVNPGSLFVALPGERHDGHEFVDEGQIEVGGNLIRNWDGSAWGPQTMLGCMKHSLNVCLAWVASEKLGASDFYSYLNAFEIG